MKKSIHLSLIIFMMTSIFAVQGQNIPANSPAGINGQLKVIGTKLCNQYDKPIQLRGMSTHGLQWFYNNCYANGKTGAFDALKNWGGDILRISMYVQEDGYETDPTGYTNKVKALIDIATARGMYALIDFHQLDPGDPNFNTARAKTFFTAIATAYKDYPNIIYDICNEPNGNSVTWAVIKNYADQVIPTIRAIDNNAVITVGTDGWATFGLSRTGSSTTYKDVVNNKLNYPNVMYSFHFYADSHRDSYLNLLDVVSNELPVFVTEFGFQNSAGEGTNNRAMSDKYITLMRNKKISWCNWNFSDDNRSGAVWKSGTCSSNNWSDGNLKEAGLWAKEYISSPADDFPTGSINQAPAVNITGPSNNAIFTAPASISITANASDADGSVSKVEFYNGSTLLNSDATAPYSYSWTGVGAGTYTITAKATDNAGATTTSSAITVTVNPVAVTQSPYGGTAASIPGTVEAAKYDLGGQNVAYYDNTTGNSGSAFRSDDVDIEASTDGGNNVGWTAAGEWTEYTVNVTAGTYKIEARVAATATGKSFRIEMDGATVATITVPNTGDWQTWQTVTVNNVSLSGGQKVMRIYNITDAFNVNTIKFSSASTTNQAPSISLTAPANNATFTAPASINITANASDADGSVSKVEFYNGSTLLNSDATAPYSYSWTGVSAGTYTITAKATDNAGATKTSSAVTVTVNSVTVTQSPYGGTAALIPGTIEAAKYDLGGQNVAYYDNTTGNSGSAFRTEDVDIEASTDGGYNVGWTAAGEWTEYTVNVTAGTYKIEARVAATATGKSFRIEMDGATVATIAVPNTGDWQTWQTVTVNNVSLSGGQKVMRIYDITDAFNVNTIKFSSASTTNQAPTVSLTAPANNATFTAPASINITANASDADGTVSKVEFYNGSTLLNSDATAPYSYTWTGVGAGTYTITARATDNSGATTTSSARTVTVNTVTTGGCSGIAQYVENNGYVPGSKVQNAGSQYECKPYPYAGWCNGAAWAYGPGTGAYWSDAWTLVGSCNARLSANNSTQATVNENTLSNSPNPFNGVTTINVTLMEASEVNMQVYNKAGQIVATIFEGHLAAGTHSLEFDSNSLIPDMYIVKCNTNNSVTTRKIVKN